MKLLKDGIVNGIGLGAGILAISIFNNAISGIITELIVTLIARLVLEHKLKTNLKERDHNLYCDFFGFTVANIAVFIGGLIHLVFPFMGAVVAAVCTERLVKLFIDRDTLT